MIIQDTREKFPLSFAMFGIDVVVRKLDTGDYTFGGFEDAVCIERKKSVSELATNIGSDWKRFAAELERMKSFSHKYILCEFPLQDVYDYPNCECIPKYKRKYIRISSKFLLSRIEYIQDHYDIIFFFCNSSTEAMEKVVELYDEITKEPR